MIMSLKQREIKIRPRIKLNHNIVTHEQSLFCLSAKGRACSIRKESRQVKKGTQDILNHEPMTLLFRAFIGILRDKRLKGK